MTVPGGHVPARRRSDQRAQLPFKGESFPDYVVHRTPPSRNAKSAEHETAHESAKKPSMTQSSPLARSSRPAQRPSLADQLKAISQSAQDVTTRLKSTYKLTGNAGSELALSTLATRTSTASSVGGNEFQATTIGMTVGRLDCRFPCPATFAHDHCAYLFQHPFEAKEVQMVMYYRDMTDVSVASRDKTFRFRVDHALHQFGNDYNPSNPQHWIKIVFATASEVDRVKQFLAQRRPSFASGNS